MVRTRLRAEAPPDLARESFESITRALRIREGCEYIHFRSGRDGEAAVFLDRAMKVALKVGPYEELLAQHRALTLLRAIGFSCPASVLRSNERSETALLVMEEFPRECMNQARRLRLCETFGPQMQRHEEEAHTLLSACGLEPEIWFGEGFENCALVPGANLLIGRTRPIQRGDLNPFDPVIGFKSNRFAIASRARA